jgi:hypothetical protein
MASNLWYGLGGDSVNLVEQADLGETVASVHAIHVYFNRREKALEKRLAGSETGQFSALAGP